MSAARRSARAYAVVAVASDLLVLYVWLGVHSVAMPTVGLVLTPAGYALHWPVAAYLAASIGVSTEAAVAMIFLIFQEFRIWIPSASIKSITWPTNEVARSINILY